MVNIPLKTAGDFCLPALGLGTWQMGGREQRNPDNEELTGEAIKSLDKSELLITSKVMSVN